jgi:hypothetical protein
MSPGQRSVLREGVVAGLIGAAIVAVWFLIIDLARGRPFFTPGVLGNLIFHGGDVPDGAAVSLGAVVGYSVIHGLAFVALGIVAAIMLAASERDRTLLIAVVILFAASEASVVALVGALSRSALGALAWWAILVGNLLAAAAMLGYFLRRHRALPAALVGPWAAVLREGVVAGLIGAGVVAAWFLVIDTLEGQPLRTPALLGMHLLRQPSPNAAIISYTVVHVLAFVAFGIVGAALVAGAETAPVFLFGLVILFTCFEVFAFGAILIVAHSLLDELAGWTIFVGNLLAAAAMLACYFRLHRGLAHRMTEAWAEDK